MVNICAHLSELDSHNKAGKGYCQRALSAQFVYFCHWFWVFFKIS